jgi:hypothetical protein
MHKNLMPKAPKALKPLPRRLQDTDELLATPLVGDLARRLVQQLEPGSDPADTVPPIASIPGLPVRLPTLLPIANFARLYFRCVPPRRAQTCPPPARASGCRALFRVIPHRSQT